MLDRTEKTEAFFKSAIEYATQARKEFLTPEMILAGFFKQKEGNALLESYMVDDVDLEEHLIHAFNTVDTVAEEVGDYDIILSEQLVEVLANSELMALAAGKSKIEAPHLLQSILMLEDSYAQLILTKLFTEDQAELMSSIIALYNGEELPMHCLFSESDYLEEWEKELRGEGAEMQDTDSQDTNSQSEEREEKKEQNTSIKEWHSLCTCLNNIVHRHNPLVGRENELQRMLEVLCRMDKNNLLLVGEPGVGKTALVYELALRINDEEVPMRLMSANVYLLNMGFLLAGTHYRGDFEKRINTIMKGAEAERNVILFIDEIHTLVGAGSNGEALDAANMIKPYLESGTIRFIGATTYKEYNRYFAKNNSLVRHFQQIDVPEPSVLDTICILKTLRERYEMYHGVKYSDEIIKYAVEASVRYIGDRFLPDKAIDLIDEAGAKTELYKEIEEIDDEHFEVSKDIIDEVLASVCKISPSMLSDNTDANLETLQERITNQIFGQDDAVKHIVEAVQMGKAGLLDEGKPIASLLFVGPTGVGKTEVCRVLAKELGIELVRFDMSEYAEKHTVAKLIGSPAGYVGYEEGGLLTDAIRKTPHCVLLLDEIEKAHSDIYNILLQVMDYARLTDSKGIKADFSHVILVMTSNAGAQFAHQAQVGFGATTSSGNAMLTTVKKTFKPEFLARLSDTVVFNDLSREMASLILKKKLNQLSSRLAAKSVTMELSPSAFDFLLQEGYDQKLGARQMERKINLYLTPLFMREILFGALKHGGTARVEQADGKLCLVV